MSVKEYKCPCCGGNLVFNSDTQKLHCPSCDNEMDMETYREYAKVVESTEQKEDTYDWGATDFGRSGEWVVKEDGSRVYKCPSCGGEIEAQETTAATKCPYCDSPVILPEQVSGGFKPDLIVPFQLDAKAAKGAYKGFCKKKALLPRSFQSDQKIKEITGIYVPFWLFSCQAEGTINYNGQRIRKWKDQQYEYIQTDYYLVSREGCVNFDYVPVDGSVEMDDAYMESIEPYDMSKAVPFDEAYLSGYEAIKYDVSKDESRGRAQERIKTSFQDILKQSVDKKEYDILMLKNSQIGCTNGAVHYALLPVWVVKVEYKDKMYRFAMNGQTGKLVGELPIDSGLFWKNALGFFAGSSIVVYLLIMLVRLFL